jgi:cell division protein FtsI/penicillin-binding protein 2
VAQRFGLGKPTGIEIPDFAGQVPYPENVNDYVQMAIGQSTLQISPLQMAMYVAAIGNGGTLYRPSVIDHITPIDGSADVYQFEPQENGNLDMSQVNLEAIQQAMVWVVNDREGTAEYQLRDVPYKLAGKTGTAENPLGDSHAWFGGYSWNSNPNKPDIAVAIVLENAGEGSEMAAPLFRRVMQLYFSNYENNGGTMPWEESPYVLATETPAP